ncbi:hypothetical protein K461DRAFT_297072 [Myriangium duriaei CBS 260.36]|uniref:Uncharacterized protein n=1 Tax=Myriangium duriaei CBS 260.36 TaxID=1168546 RepID=A0A9P4MJB4_9PEZI|nr:hypothetical protein K461DRAFT_297072 [Myriangium duriaei CBS 260.36]
MPPPRLPKVPSLPPLYIRIDHSTKPVNPLAPAYLLHAALDFRHPLHLISRRKLRLKAQNQPLKWDIASPLSVSSSSCVRNWARRRVVAAFKAALEKRGWDEHGRAVDGDERELKGWVRILVDARTVTDKFAEVEARADQAVRKVIASQPQQQSRRQQQRQPYQQRPTYTGDGGRGESAPSAPAFTIRRM